MADGVLRCPRCGAGMVTFQRGEVVLDECAACRGVFLGRGQLERLVARGPALVNGHPVTPSYEGRHRNA